MKRALMLTLIALALIAAGCYGGVVGSGRLITRDLALSGFTRIEATSAFEIEVVQGNEYAVSLTADDNIIDNVDATVIADTLRLGLKPSVGFRNLTLRARVTMPVLRGVGVSGASQADVRGFETDGNFDLDLSGASSIAADIRAGDTRVEASGASRVTLSGSGRDLDLRGSGASSLDLTDYTVRNVNAELSGASRATVSASGTLDANLSGASRLRYRGSPTLGRIETTGGSSLDQD
ncbi:MAG: head GIN domain-containing protein [Anaerolineae bacterium]